MRRTTSLAAVLFGATLLAPTGAATAVGETCRGQAATIVGDGSAIRGTQGRDVVITHNSQTIHTRGGDDLVCVTRRAMGARVTPASPSAPVPGTTSSMRAPLRVAGRSS